MGPTWVLSVPRWAPCWPHAICYQGSHPLPWISWSHMHSRTNDTLHPSSICIDVSYRRSKCNLDIAIWDHHGFVIIKHLCPPALPTCRFISTHWDRDKMANICQTTFSNAFSRMKMNELWLKCHWSLFLRVKLTILQRWLRQWLGTDKATSHYLNKWWLVYRRIYALLGRN